MELKDVLREEREKKGFSLRKLARESNVSQAYLSQIEKGKSKNPNTDKLLAISYALDSQGYDEVFLKLANSSDTIIEEPKKMFNQYVNSQTYNQDLTKINNRMRINKKDSSVIELDLPSFDIEWLLEQNEYHVFLGSGTDNVINQEGDHNKELLILEPNEKIKLKEVIKKEKQQILESRKLNERHIEFGELISKADEYTLIFDLLNDDVDDEDVRQRLAPIVKDREIFVAKEYYNEIKKAANNKDAITLQKLVRMKTIEELQQFLSEH
ncbi:MULTISPECIES: helix-turn-helix transcriptional regulator [unclassified Mammaliicoccus]|uniref:helix-turn-helix domain-containing protein n=1 Tax=unclassified Mammaliicoccus TaxID=2803851 RepID=UPI001EFA33E4|nr:MULTISPECIES: helix-turn-helix transcriptional regulator [unclassified Mammaliicoccus]